MSELLEKDAKYVWHPFTQMKTEGSPIPMIKGEGTLLFDETGKSYIDCNSSWWVNTHGHGHPHIKNALLEQFDKLDHTLLAGVTHPKAAELSERIVKLLGGDFQKVFFSDNGSTSTEVALKMSFQYWYNLEQPKHKVLAIEGAYHGDTFGAMSVGERDYFNKPFEPFFFDVDFLEFPTEEKEAEQLKKAENLFKTDEFACMILEPLVQGSSGMRMYSISFLDKLVALAKKYNVLVIFDEVMTGWGRTGKMFAKDFLENQPDIICLSKGLTAGALAMGLTVTSQDIFDVFYADDRAKALLHGHSYTGNPLSCAVACANLDLFENPEVAETIISLEKAHISFKNKLEKHPKVKEIRTQGTIMALEIETGEGNTYFSKLRNKAYQYFIDNGMLLRPLGNVVFLNPPYCITEEELNYCYTVITRFLDEEI